MSGTVCCYVGCKKSYSTNKETSFFSFPDDPKRRKKWMQNSGNLELENLSERQLRGKRICSDHFTAKSFVTESKRTLNDTAVPIVTKAVPSSSKPPTTPATSKPDKSTKEKLNKSEGDASKSPVGTPTPPVERSSRRKTITTAVISQPTPKDTRKKEDPKIPKSSEKEKPTPSQKTRGKQAVNKQKSVEEVTAEVVSTKSNEESKSASVPLSSSVEKSQKKSPSVVPKSPNKKLNPEVLAASIAAVGKAVVAQKSLPPPPQETVLTVTKKETPLKAKKKNIKSPSSENQDADKLKDSKIVNAAEDNSQKEETVAVIERKLRVKGKAKRVSTEPVASKSPVKESKTKISTTVPVPPPVTKPEVYIPEKSELPAGTAKKVGKEKVSKSTKEGTTTEIKSKHVTAAVASPSKKKGNKQKKLNKSADGEAVKASTVKAVSTTNESSAKPATSIPDIRDILFPKEKSPKQTKQPKGIQKDTPTLVMVNLNKTKTSESKAVAPTVVAEPKSKSPVKTKTMPPKLNAEMIAASIATVGKTVMLLQQPTKPIHQEAVSKDGAPLKKKKKLKQLSSDQQSAGTGGGLKTKAIAAGDLPLQLQPTKKRKLDTSSKLVLVDHGPSKLSKEETAKIIADQVSKMGDVLMPQKSAPATPVANTTKSKPLVYAPRPPKPVVYAPKPKPVVVSPKPKLVTVQKIEVDQDDVSDEDSYDEYMYFDREFEEIDRCFGDDVEGKADREFERFYATLRKFLRLSGKWSMGGVQWDPQGRRKVIIISEPEIPPNGRPCVKRCLQFFEDKAIRVFIDGMDMTDVFGMTCYAEKEDVASLVCRVAEASSCCGVPEMVIDDLLHFPHAKQRNTSYFDSKCPGIIPNDSYDPICSPCKGLQQQVHESRTNEKLRLLERRKRSEEKQFQHPFGEALYTMFSDLVDETDPTKPKKKRNKETFFRKYLHDTRYKIEGDSAKTERVYIEKPISVDSVSASFQDIVSKLGFNAPNMKRNKSFGGSTSSARPSLSTPKPRVFPSSSGTAHRKVPHPLEHILPSFAAGSSFTLDDGQEYELIGEVDPGSVGSDIVEMKHTPSQQFEIIEVDDETLAKLASSKNQVVMLPEAATAFASPQVTRIDANDPNLSQILKAINTSHGYRIN